MSITAADLPDDPDELKQLILSLSEQGEETEHERARLEKKVEVLVDEISLLRLKLFGKRSEKLSEDEILQGRLNFPWKIIAGMAMQAYHLAPQSPEEVRGNH